MKIKNPFQKIYEQCAYGMMSKKAKDLPEFPTMLDVELTNYCNMNCIMCPVGTGRMQRERGEMTIPTLLKILDEAAKYKTAIRYIRWGEPMLSTIVGDVIVETKKRNLLCHINTNGLLVHREWMRFFVAEGLDSIKFSMQGLNQREYLDWRQADQYFPLLRKIEELKIIRTKLNAKNPYIQIGTTVNNDPPQDKIEAFRKIVSKYADDVYVSKTMDLDKRRNPNDYCECPEVFDKLSVDWDGKVTACCGDYDNFMVIGDLKTQTLKEIWKGKELREIRRKLLDYRHGDLRLCSRCARSTDNEMR